MITKRDYNIFLDKIHKNIMAGNEIYIHGVPVQNVWGEKILCWVPGQRKTTTIVYQHPDSFNNYTSLKQIYNSVELRMKMK